MGSSLIGYMVRGPRVLNQEALDRAQHVLETRISHLREAYDLYEPTMVADGDGESDEAQLDNLEDVFQAYFPDADWGFYGVELVTAVEEILATSPAELVGDLKALWAGSNASDCAYRDYGDERVMFCGDGTWGDEPDGVGYATLSKSVQLGLAKLLGIA